TVWYSGWVSGFMADSRAGARAVPIAGSVGFRALYTARPVVKQVDHYSSYSSLSGLTRQSAQWPARGGSAWMPGSKPGHDETEGTLPPAGGAGILAPPTGLE